MTKNEFIEQLDLPFAAEPRGKDYVIKLSNSNDFSEAYNIISNNEQLVVDDNSITTTDNALFIFYSDEFEVKLTADFNKDIYRLVVSDR